MTDDVMTADEARALLADVAPRRVCAMCGAVDPPTVRDTIGGDAVDLHDGCSGEVRGRVDTERGLLRYEDALRALRAVVALHGRLEAPQRPQASPVGGEEPGGDGAPARGLPVAPLWERVRVVAREEALPRPRLASLFVASVALGTLGLPEPHIEVIRGEVVLTWQSDDVTATAAVRASGVWTRFWCDDGGPVRSGVEMRTLDLAAPGAIPAWWIAVARRCHGEGPSGRSVAAEGETAPEGDGGR